MEDGKQTPAKKLEIIANTVDRFARNYNTSINDRERKDTDLELEDFLKKFPEPIPKNYKIAYNILTGRSPVRDITLGEDY